MRASIKFALICLIFAIVNVGLVNGWSNGGYSTDPTNPKYGTHDWIAQHALDWLPTREKQYILDNLAAYLYGTELPDNANAPGGDGIDDTTKHHVYYSSSGTVTDDASAKRAESEYNLALNYLKAQDYVDAAKTAGTMTHYIADVAVFGHVMGSSTPWGSEVHHSDYESYVDARTSSYTGSFNTFLSFDGSLSTLSAYNGALNLAYDTTFGGSNHLTCVWMDTNYNWNNPTFANRCGESLNLAVNTVTDVLHTLYLQAGLSNSPTPTAISTATPIPLATSTSNPTSSSTPTLTPIPPPNPITTPSSTPMLTTTSTSAPSSKPTDSIKTPTDAVNPNSTKNLNGPTVPEYATIILILSAVIAAVAILLIMLTFVQIRMRKSRKLSKEHR